MVRDGFFLALCVACTLTGSVPRLAADERADAVARTLAVQTALQQGRDLLRQGDARGAVTVLESQLTRIDGNRDYLAVLRDAYRAHVKELRLARQDAVAEAYQQRLQILERGAPAAEQTPTPPPTAAPQAPANPPAPAPRPQAVVRAKADDVAAVELGPNQRESRRLLDRAEEEFAQKRYAEASCLYEQASRLDRAAVEPSRERWGFCKLRGAGEQLNRAATGPCPPELEQEVRQAMDWSPRLQGFGQTLLQEIEGRRGGADPGDDRPVALRHLPTDQKDWAAVETDNFRIFHPNARDVAEKAAKVAERTRAAMQRRWFGEVSADWSPKCDVFLHATARDYSQRTGAPTNSPGHCTVGADGRVLTRKIDLHLDDPNLLAAVLPHEATHVVLAGRFGGHHVPRWADEGMAVLTEPREKVDRHLRHLPRYRQDNQLFTMRQLLTMAEYPEARWIGPFYAQSVSVVDFLSRQKGPQTFAQFVRDGLQGGYEAALRRHYGFQDFNELDRRWQEFAFSGAASASLRPAAP